MCTYFIFSQFNLLTKRFIKRPGICYFKMISDKYKIKITVISQFLFTSVEQTTRLNKAWYLLSKKKKKCFK